MYSARSAREERDERLASSASTPRRRAPLRVDVLGEGGLDLGVVDIFEASCQPWTRREPRVFFPRRLGATPALPPAARERNVEARAARDGGRREARTARARAALTPSSRVNRLSRYGSSDDSVAREQSWSNLSLLAGRTSCVRQRASSAVRRRASRRAQPTPSVFVLGAALPYLFCMSAPGRLVLAAPSKDELVGALPPLSALCTRRLRRRKVRLSAGDECANGSADEVARPHHRCVEGRSLHLFGAAPDRAAALAAAVQHHLAWRTTKSLSRRRITGSSPASRSRTTSSVQPVRL